MTPLGIRLGFFLLRNPSNHFSPPSPFMWRHRNDHYYFDNYMQMWKLTPTGDPQMPLMITLEKRP